MSDNKKCPVCGTDEAEVSKQDINHDFVECPACGRFEINTYPQGYDGKPKDKDKLASYLFYNNGKTNIPINVNRDYFFNFIGKKNRFDELKSDLDYCYWVNNDIVECWYPKTFSEKVDMFLLMLAEKSNYIGDLILFTDDQLLSACFAIRENKGVLDFLAQLKQQCEVFLDYLIKNQFIRHENHGYVLQPEGWKRVDELQKRKPNSKNVFVAMSFAQEMATVRDAIKTAVLKCGYIPRIMDEIEHNHQIVPEMLYEIRQAKFVIAELTGHNNGAYFEAGYALGQGKDVIQLCRKDTFGQDGHFDVKQVSTILWEDEVDLTERLINRIESTIE